jgi:transcriptional regulator with XRE-family HTH domain
MLRFTRCRLYQTFPDAQCLQHCGVASESSILSVLSERLKHFRGKKGWTQEDLAKRATINRTYLAEIERGRRNPSLRNLIKLSNALEIPLIALFDDGLLDATNPTRYAKVTRHKAR